VTLQMAADDAALALRDALADTERALRDALAEASMRCDLCCASRMHDAQCRRGVDARRRRISRNRDFHNDLNASDRTACPFGAIVGPLPERIGVRHHRLVYDAL